MKRGTWLALASLVVVPFARDAFQAPQLVVLALAALVAEGTRSSRPVGQVLGLSLLAAVVTAGLGVAPLLSVPSLLALTVTMAFAAASAQLELDALTWTAFPLAAFAVLQALGADPIPWQAVARWCGGTRPFATLGHPTQLGMWSACLTVVAFDAWLRRREAWRFGACLLALMTCVLTMSRAGWLVLVVAFGLWAALQRAQLGARLRLGLAASTIGAALVGVLLAGPTAAAERVANALVAPTRRMLWETALEGFSQRPVSGWGAGAFVLVDQQLRQADAWRYEWGGTAFHAHAFPAEVLATQGLIGLAALVAALVVTVRAWRSSQPWRREPLALALLAGLAAGSLVTFLAVVPATLALVALVKTLGAPAERTPPRRWLAAGPLVVASAAFVAGLLPAPLAGRLEPWNPSWLALEGVGLEAAGALDDAAVVFDRAAERFGALAIVHGNRGRVASKRGRHDDAARDYATAVSLAPRDGRLLLDAAEASLRAQAWADAEATVVRLLQLYPDDGPAWFALGRLRVMQQRRVEARAAFEAAEQADWRDWPDGLGLARHALAFIHLAEGNPDLAGALRARPTTFATPAEACGAPALLR